MSRNDGDEQYHRLAATASYRFFILQQDNILLVPATTELEYRPYFGGLVR